MLRVLRACRFSHSLGRLRWFERHFLNGRNSALSSRIARRSAVANQSSSKTSSSSHFRDAAWLRRRRAGRTSQNPLSPTPGSSRHPYLPFLNTCLMRFGSLLATSLNGETPMSAPNVSVVIEPSDGALVVYE